MNDYLVEICREGAMMRTGGTIEGGRMKVGFTGTRQGMTPEQKATLAALVGRLGMTEAHHGDCIGADSEFDDIVWLRIPAESLVIHPPEKNDLRALCGEPGNVARPPKGYFARNRDIVDETDVLIGCPPAMHELPEGGTWYTLRYARDKRKKPTVVIWPDGTTTAWNGAEVQ